MTTYFEIVTKVILGREKAKVKTLCHSCNGKQLPWQITITPIAINIIHVALCCCVRHLKILCNVTLVRLDHHVGLLTIVYHCTDTLVEINIAFKVILDKTLITIVLIVYFAFPFTSGISYVLLLYNDRQVCKSEIGRRFVVLYIGFINKSITLYTKLRLFASLPKPIACNKMALIEGIAILYKGWCLD